MFPCSCPVGVCLHPGASICMYDKNNGAISMSEQTDLVERLRADILILEQAEIEFIARAEAAEAVVSASQDWIKYPNNTVMRADLIGAHAAYDKAREG